MFDRLRDWISTKQPTPEKSTALQEQALSPQEMELYGIVKNFFIRREKILQKWAPARRDDESETVKRGYVVNVPSKNDQKNKNEYQLTVFDSSGINSSLAWNRYYVEVRNGHNGQIVYIAEFDNQNGDLAATLYAPESEQTFSASQVTNLLNRIEQSTPPLRLRRITTFVNQLHALEHASKPTQTDKKAHDVSANTGNERTSPAEPIFSNFQNQPQEQERITQRLKTARKEYNQYKHDLEVRIEAAKMNCFMELQSLFERLASQYPETSEKEKEHGVRLTWKVKGVSHEVWLTTLPKSKEIRVVYLLHNLIQPGVVYKTLPLIESKFKLSGENIAMSLPHGLKVEGEALVQHILGIREVASRLDKATQSENPIPKDMELFKTEPLNEENIKPEDIRFSQVRTAGSFGVAKQPTQSTP